APVAITENVIALGLAMIAEKNAALHFWRLHGSGDSDHRRREIDAIDHPRVASAGLEVRGSGKIFRPMNDERHEKSFLVAELFPARVRLAIVAEKEDDRIVGESVRFQCFENSADLPIHFRR